VGLPPTEDRVNPRDELVEPKGLLHVVVGARTIALRATDVVGNNALVEEIRLEMTENTPAVVSDGNDGIDEAATIACRETVAVDGVDADWFVVDAPAGHTVAVNVANPGYDIVTTDGTTIIDSGKHVAVEGAPLSVAVAPPDFRGGATTLTVECTPPAVEPEVQSCAFAGAPSLLAWLAIAFRFRRRRAQATPGPAER
jgi:hypothetical protein